jgi:hypothetical protein
MNDELTNPEKSLIGTIEPVAGEDDLDAPGHKSYRIGQMAEAVAEIHWKWGYSYR